MFLPDKKCALDSEGRGLAICATGPSASLPPWYLHAVLALQLRRAISEKLLASKVFVPYLPLSPGALRPFGEQATRTH